MMVRVHFVNVGHGDCTVVEFQDAGRVAVIDINRSSDYDETTLNEMAQYAWSHASKASQYLFKAGVMSADELFTEAGVRLKPNDPIAYLRNFSSGKPFRFISTHPHMDHLSGLTALRDEFGFSNFWVVRNSLQPTDKLDAQQQKDWDLYKSYRDATKTKFDDVKIVRPMEDDSMDFWEQDGIQILSPCQALIDLAHQKNNPNIMSYVLLITYGETRILLGGDAVEETWEYIYENHQDLIQGISILKASHHGRETGYHQPSLELMKPGHVIVSVGKKPVTDASNKYRKYSENVWSTRWKGNIVFELKLDGSGTYETEYE